MTSEPREMLDETFIERQLESYEKLLASPVMKEIQNLEVEKKKVLKIREKG